MASVKESTVAELFGTLVDQLNDLHERVRRIEESWFTWDRLHSGNVDEFRDKEELSDVLSIIADPQNKMVLLYRNLRDSTVKALKARGFKVSSQNGCVWEVSW